MTKMTRIVSKSLGLALAAGLLVSGAIADSHGDNAGLIAAVIGSTPTQPIGGVLSGGAAWVVSKGLATLNGNGGVNVHVEGLLLAPGTTGAGTTGPVTTVTASLVCGGTGGSVVATTAAVPLSTEGNAHIKDKFTLPASCVAPVILVRANGATGPYIAATGFRNDGTGTKSDDQDSDH